MSKKKSKGSEELENELSLEKKDTEKENTLEESDNFSESEPKPVLPRKRKITKNIQLIVSASITGAALLFIIIWGLFFNQSIVGVWNYEIFPEETSDTADETASTSDEPVSPEIISYEFKSDGVCIASYGTISYEGTYSLASTEAYGNVVAVSVLSDTFAYEVKGNAFTGRRLELKSLYYDDDDMTLKKGRPKDPLTPFENPVLDDRLIGKWYDSENEITYEFTKDGEFYRSTSDGYTVRHIYSTMDSNQIVAKYYGEFEDTHTFSYAFENDMLYIDGYIASKIDD